MSLRKEEIEELIKNQLAIFDEKLNGRLEQLEKNLTKDIEYLKKDLLNVEKSLSIVEKNTRLQVEAMTLALNKFKERENLKHQAIETKLTMANATTENSMNRCRDEMRALKSALETIKNSTKAALAEIDLCKPKGSMMNAQISEILQIKDFREEIRNELESSRFDEMLSKSCSAIRDLYKHFPSGMCYYECRNGEVGGKKKTLICPLIRKNYMKRASHWTPIKLDTPFEVSIGGKCFKVTEFHRMNYGGEARDDYFIVPEIFEDYYRIHGFEFLQKNSDKIKISQKQIHFEVPGNFKYKLHECYGNES